MLTQTRLRELLHYAPETGVFTWLVPSKNGIKVGDRAGCLRKSQRHGGPDYRVIRLDLVLFLEHRLAWLYMTGAFPPSQLDHENNKPFDNRWTNLRIATNAQNNQNMPKKKNNRSGFKGVSLDPRRGTYNADCQAEGKRIRKSGFKTAEEAYAFYQLVAVDTHKEFYHG
jgi:hypothetical protein